MRDTIEDKLSATLAAAIKDEIDWEILKGIYVKGGYTEVNFYPIRNAVEAQQISLWCRDNVKGHLKSHGSCFMFEHKEEAMMFRLRWGG